MLKILTNKTLDTIFPPRCFSCNETSGTSGALCFSCWNDINFITNNSCKVCDIPFEHEIERGTICGACITDGNNFNKAKAVFIYDDASKKLITRFKYGDKTYPAKSFAKWMANRGEELINEADIICPVPLHAARMFIRKYNQSALLSNLIAKNKPIRNIPDLMIRTINNPPQAAFSQKERHKNVKNIFAVKNRYTEIVKDSKILLIDDVITTGSTVNECAKALKTAGAKKVFILALARTKND